MTLLILAITSLLTSWQFAKEQNDHQMPVAEDKHWQEVSVPHDWAIYGPFDRANDLQNVTVWQNGATFPSIKTGRTGGLPYMGSAWYKTIVTLPSTDAVDLPMSNYFLLFDGAMSEAEVFVNGEKVCFWPYGYNAFHCDITALIKEGANEIAVRLQNREQSSRWYPGAGLYRNVHLIEKPKVYVPIWGTHITTPYVTEQLASVNIKTRVENALNKHIELRTSLIHKATGEVVDSLVSHYDVKHNLPLEQNITIHNPALWSPETPNLYVARTCVIADSVYQETVETTFGVRSVQIVPNVGFLLNGKVRKIQGVCLHHDLGPLGSAINKDALRRQLLILKEMGCDAIRTSHNMPAPEQIELCDELGLMVMCEPFDEWDWAKCKSGYSRFFNEWAERDMVNMLHHFRNNPSIIMWSIGNEVPTQCDPQGYKTAKMLQDICVREDGTRPCTAGMDQVTCVLENGFASVLQIVGLNYRPHRYLESYQRTPQHLILGSETASTVSSRGVYLLPALPDDTDHITNMNHPGGNSQTNQCSSYDLQYCPWSNLPDDDFRNMDDYAWTIGQFVWTGFDYLGEPSPWDTDAWPSHSSYFGIIDLAGIPKDRYYLYRSMWRKDVHTVHLLPHWNWNTGDTLPVMAYTDAAEGELFVNGKSMGKVRKLTREESEAAIQAGDPLGLQRRYRLIWDNIPYEAGEIKVVTPVGEAIRKTAGAPHHIEMYVEEYPTNLNDSLPLREGVGVGSLHFVRVRVCDANGNLCPQANHLIRFATKGEGTFRAAANGDAANLDLFHMPQHHAFAGELTAIVEGSCTLTATAKGLKKAIITIQ